VCGINGFTYAARAAADDEGELALVRAMNDALIHRGPDDGGEITHGRAILGMRRLSIVDVEHGHQPMRSADGRFAIVYNGELYDYREARVTLEKRGVALATQSDTEVVLQSYALHGLSCLDSFNGMFAFAIADADDGSLLLVRDQIGIKPLYYYHAADGTLVFSSELGALLRHPGVPRRLDHESLAMLLVDRYVADPYTLFDGVRELPPGHWLRWNDGKVDVRSYYHFEPAPVQRDEAGALEELRERLDAATRSQLVADVPVGAFLSGGIDSSTVVAFANRHDAAPLHTFSVGFAEKAYDESVVARAVASHLGTEHHQLHVEHNAFDRALLDRVVRHLGQPLEDVSCIPTLLVSDFAGRHVKVVMSGDGGDEFFGGYPYMFWAGRIARTRERVPRWIRRVGRGVLSAVPGGGTGLRRVHKALSLTEYDLPEMLRRLMAQWSPEELPSLLVEPPAELRPVLFRAVASDPALAPEERAMDYFAKTRLAGSYLRKVDRMSMAASLEVRVPLLDRRVFEYALTLPLSLKVRGGVGKYLLRKAGRPLLPDSVYSHPKQGFLPPMAQWFNDEFWRLIEGVCAPGGELARLFRPEALSGVIADGRNPYADQRRVSSDAAAARAWTLAQLGCWIEAFGVTI
jgi:asparagine synthase (glutamine-hydrolysing)